MAAGRPGKTAEPHDYRRCHRPGDTDVKAGNQRCTEILNCKAKSMKAKNTDMDCWQRIEAVIGWAKMSTNGFARYIGLARGENLYQIKRGNNGISLDVAERICAKFPQIDKLWLLAGDGQMFIREHEESAEIARYKQALDEALEREKIQQKVITDLRRASQELRGRAVAAFKEATDGYFVIGAVNYAGAVLEKFEQKLNGE